MKASELREIVEIVSKLEDFDLGFDFDYNDILKLNNEDVELIIKNKESDNVLVLLQFLIYCDKNKDKENFLEELRHLECLDIKSVVSEKIIAADSQEKADVIYDYFACSEIVSLFKTEEEWKTYLDELYKSFDDDCISHFVFFIKKFKDLQNVGIKKVMRFIKDTCDDFIEEIKYLDDPSFSEEEWSNIFDLLYEGYEKDGVFRLVTRFKECREQEIFEEENAKILEYLLNEEEHFDEDLPKFFSIISLEETDDIIKFLCEVNSDDMFRHYIRSYNSYVEIVLRKYYSTILNTKSVSLQNTYNSLRNNDTHYFNELVKESSEKKEKDKDSCTKIEVIMNTLETIYYSDDLYKRVGLYSLVNALPHVPYDVWYYVVTNFDLSKAKLILMNYEHLVCMFGNTSPFLNRFLNISYDNLIMIFRIMELESFKNDPNKFEVYELMLNDDNQKSLDYIFQVYLEQEKKKEQKKKIIREQIGDISSISFQTVASLLNRECEIDKVLDGFDDEDEITPNTLVRTLKYRNPSN